MAQCRIEVLGPPRIYICDKEHHSLRRKTIALISYLIVENRAVARDKLATLFWPESGQSAARRSLRTCLHEVRSLFSEEIVLTGSDTVSVLRNRIESDYHELLEMVRTPPPVLLQKLSADETVLRLLSVGEFMEGFTLPDCRDFDDWQFQSAEMVRSLRSEAIRSIAEQAICDAYPEAVVELTQALIRWDPMEEESYRLLMRVLAAAGLFRAAEEQYERCVEVLDKELGVEPDEETNQLAARIRRHDPELLSKRAHISFTSNRSNLPAERDTFFGREAEMKQLREILTSADSRLVTLTGPAGSGKTRLATHIARELMADFPDGVVFVELSSVHEVGEVMPAIGTAAGLRDRTFGTDSALRLAEQLNGWRLLIVADNFEHVVDAAPSVAELIAHTHDLVLLITSREALRITGEKEVNIMPLELPRSGQREEVLASPAVQLLLDRASQIGKAIPIDNNNVEKLQTIVNRLDGLPLALELAVPLLRMRTVGELAERLSPSTEPLDSRWRDSPERHRSIERAFDWSYNLLCSAEQRLFAELSVFANGYDCEAVAAVCESLDDTFCALLEKNLVRANDSPAGRTFGMLGPIRDYARSKRVTEFSALDTELRHASYYSFKALEIAEALTGAGQLQAQDKLTLMRENIVTALRHFLLLGEFERGLELASRLSHFWYRSNRFREGSYWIRTFLQKDSAGVMHAYAWYGLGMLTFYMGEWRKACDHLRTSIAQSDHVEDTTVKALALSFLGVGSRWLGDVQRGWRYQEEALRLARSQNDSWILLYALIVAYCTAGGEFPFPAPFTQLQEGIDLATEREDRWSLAHLYNGLGDLYVVSRNEAWAELSYARSIELFKDFNDRYLIAWNYEGLSRLKLDTEGPAEAARWSWKAFELFDDLGDELNRALMLARTARITALDASHGSFSAKLAGASYASYTRIRQEEVCGAPQVTEALEVIEPYRTEEPAKFDSGRLLSRRELLLLGTRLGFYE